MSRYIFIVLVVISAIVVKSQDIPETNNVPVETPIEDVKVRSMPVDTDTEIISSGMDHDANKSARDTAADSPQDSDSPPEAGDNKYDPMRSRFAPPEDDQKGGGGPPHVITEARLKDIRSLLMYPYYDKGSIHNKDGDYQTTVQSSVSQVHKNLNFQLPFYGFRFNYTRVSLNGYLEFSDPPTKYNYPMTFPVKDYPKVNDPSFIGIFWSKCRAGSLRVEDYDRREPGLYFRLERDLRDRRDRMGVEIRERLKWDLREGVIGSDSFDPKHAIIATWKNVSFNGGITPGIHKTNTFQMVVATDEVFTYVMFNYLDLQWTSHTEAGGDTTTGEGGTPAFIGFNAGNGTRSFEYKPYSQASVIRDVTSTGFANDLPGRHVFRIDEEILLGTCNKDIDGANLRLVFAPESGNMLGGTVVNITGPCFELTDTVLCKFDVADVVTGVVVDRNRAICIQPKLSVEGYVPLEIAIGSGVYKWKGLYFVETPATATQKIFFSDMTYNDRSPKELRITWVKENLTRNDNANIRMSLWGYRETTIKPQFLYITDLADGLQNTGAYSIIPSQYRNRENTFLTDLQFGFIQINLTDSIPVGENGNVKITPVIWSRPIPLAWYFEPQWSSLHGSHWPVVMCDNWLKDDRYMKNFAHELPQCPCHKSHALADKGRFMPDFDCDKDSNPLCYYQKTARHCVRSGSPTPEGAEQQCCYDKLDNLMLSYDQIGGSNPRRSHNLGYSPYTESTKIPTLSQWYHDMVPKFVCCRWQDEQAVGCETFRFERRPTQDCVAYQAPGIAGIYGDPHIMTFDDLEYTFNGKGEFVLVKSSTASQRLEVQGRFEQMPDNEYEEVLATQLTSVVARGNQSTTIEIRTRPPESTWRYRLDVIADGKKIYFDRPSLKFQHFPGVTVYTPTYILNQSEVIIMFDSGAGVEVIENRGFLSARVYLPWTFINKTMGLFGNWSFDMTDDFTLPDGTKSGFVGQDLNTNNMEEIYKNFGMKWMLDGSDEYQKGLPLFFRTNGKTAADYNNKEFIPKFGTNLDELIPGNHSRYRNLTEQYCSVNNFQCRYDYAVTFNRDLAHFTTNYRTSLIALKELTRKPVTSCGVLETPRFGWKSNFFFTPGHKVTFECSQDFILVGDNRRECMSDGTWNLPQYGYTECLRQQEYSKQQAGVTAGIIMAVLIPLLLLFAYVAYKYIQKRNKAESEDMFKEEFDKAATEKSLQKLTAADPDDHDTDPSSSPAPSSPVSKETII